MQKYIGNILVSNLNYKVDSCFNKVKSLDEINNDLPILIIGLDNAKKLISDFNILKRCYHNDNILWWTLSKTEKRTDYDKNMTDFYNFCIDNILTKIIYKNISIIDLKYTETKHYIEYIRNNSKKYYYIDKDKFVFIYDRENTVNSKHIYGFSLSTASFFGLSKRKILNLIENNPNNKQIKNFYSIPNSVRRLINDDIVNKMVLNEYFT